MNFCACSYDDFDQPEFYRESYPVARKQYKCCECRSTIFPGQRYHSATGKWDGEIENFRTCIPCSRLRNEFCAGFGELHTVIRDCLGFDYLEVPEDD